LKGSSTNPNPGAFTTGIQPKKTASADEHGGDLAQIIGRQHGTDMRSARSRRIGVWVLAAVLAAGCIMAEPTIGAAQSQAQSQAKPKGDSHMTEQQAKELFALVDELVKFSSDESGLALKNPVKRQLTTRDAVESYLSKKFDEDQDAKRMQRDEVVLKKFGLLDRDFALKPFLLALLKEQIEAYYDSKTKTVNLLDWVNVNEQKPVLAHELTHVLQDQHADLEKWDDQTPEDVSTNSAGDNDHLARDEMDTARDAVAEGQATAVMMDYVLKPMGKSLIKDPEVMELLKEKMTGAGDSPVMARAPLLLSESMLFPYREGLSFEQDIWMDQGRDAAFAGALDHPPSSTWEIINPRVYEARKTPVIPLMPDIHPLVDKIYQPYDIGQIGQLDVHIMAQLFGGDKAARNLTPAWNGGMYWAGQLRSAMATGDQKAAGDSMGDANSTKSLAIFYYSAWRNVASAQAFARLYSDSLGRKYSGLKEDAAAEKSASPVPGEMEQVFTTTEGPVVITIRGTRVFVAESFPLDMARKLTALILDAQGTGELKMARSTRRDHAPAVQLASYSKQVGGRPNESGVRASFSGAGGSALSGRLARFMNNCGVLKAAVDGAIAGIR
jgi:hypothetical protein